MALSTAASTPLSTSFTYQGQPIEGGTPANGTCDLRFTLFDGASAEARWGYLWRSSRCL